MTQETNQPIYSDAPEAVVHDAPEAERSKTPAALESPGVGIQVGGVGGMKASSFWILLGLIYLVVIGATVGGAVGGSLAAGKNHHTGTVTETVTTSGTNISATSATPVSSPPVTTATPNPSSDCAGSNGTVYSSLFLNGSYGPVSPDAGVKFTRLCGIQSYGTNLALAYVLTFEACIELCASLNFWNENSGCFGVAYKPTGVMPGNCWARIQTASGPDSDFDSAALVA